MTSTQSPTLDIEEYLDQHEKKDLLRFITCGSVDDGKSTLIGRLLYDSSSVFEDHLDAITRDSRRFGTTGESPDLALLVDGLQSEREQGITIDVAYRYFSTSRRKFIIADTPGHEQYTRNMATGASAADLAILLVDARKGVLSQTKRHAYITTLMGIRNIVLAVNKMDLVGWARETFEDVIAAFQNMLESLEIKNVNLIPVPISALTGDNVVRPGKRLSWYKGETLLEILETVDIERDTNFDDMRVPIQYVVRPNSEFRGYAGTIASGQIQVGDEVMVLPSRRRSRVRSIITYDGELQRAYTSQAVTVTLEDEIDIVRGDMLVHSDNAATVDNSFEATLVWMTEKELRPDDVYDIKIGPKETRATILAITNKRDMDSLIATSTAELGMNDIGTCLVELAEKVPFDPYETLPATGAFILIDRLTNATVAAGMIRQPTRVASPDRATNVTWHSTHVTKELRSQLKHQKPCVLWFTGLSGAGKSTIANGVEQRLAKMGYHTYLLDGDNVRHGLNRDLSFSDEDRIENIRRIGEVAKLFVDAGLIVLTAFISPFRSDRQMVRELLGSDEFLEAFIDTPLEVAERRDPKGLYAKARAGEITNFTGIDSPYERPQTPDIHLKTEGKTVEEAVNELLDGLISRWCQS